MAEYTEKEALIANIKNLPTCWADAGGVYGRSMKYPEGMFDCEDVISSVENAPSADVAPVRHGRWVLVNKAYDKYKCSNCGELDYITIGQKYCIYCGAKMDGGDNTEC